MIDGRLAAIRAKLREAGAEALLVTAAPNVRYLSSFSSPDDAVVLVTTEGAKLLTDGRYTAQAAEESVIPVEIVSGLQDAALGLLHGAKLAVEADSLTLADYRTLAGKLGYEPVALTAPFESLRLVKSHGEIERLREAARVTDEAFTAALEVIRAGTTEVEVALELERAMRQGGASGTSFDTIVASGARGAMPHGVASHKKIAEGELVTLDFGAVVGGYHADMTRTVAVGQVGAEERRMFDAVLEAQEAALAAVRPGVSGRELDAVARDKLREHGLDKQFVHSLGHGTGLVIHEGPRLSQRSDDVLKPGMIVTVEPGVYFPGFTGLRIEDLAVVTDDGYELLSHSPKGFISL